MRRWQRSGGEGESESEERGDQQCLKRAILGHCDEQRQYFQHHWLQRAKKGGNHRGTSKLRKPEGLARRRGSKWATEHCIDRRRRRTKRPSRKCCLSCGGGRVADSGRTDEDCFVRTRSQNCR